MKHCLLLLLGLDWQNFLIGERDWQFLIMVGIRTIIMFLVVLVGLRLLGKRGVSQLSVFELGVIIGLGSAAGDPMFYKNVGVLSCILVFAIIVGMYHLLKYVTGKSDRLDKWVEGNPVDLLVEGQLIIKHLNKEPLTREEFFSQLRSNSVSHLGQVRQAILEPSGQVSIFYYKDEEVKYGMPILPQSLNKSISKMRTGIYYSCTSCGHTMIFEMTSQKQCPVCKNDNWIKSTDEKRIS